MGEKWFQMIGKKNLNPNAEWFGPPNTAQLMFRILEYFRELAMMFLKIISLILQFISVLWIVLVEDWLVVE